MHAVFTWTITTCYINWIVSSCGIHWIVISCYTNWTIVTCCISLNFKQVQDSSFCWHFFDISMSFLSCPPTHLKCSCIIKQESKFKLEKIFAFHAENDNNSQNYCWLIRLHYFWWKIIAVKFSLVKLVTLQIKAFHCPQWKCNCKLMIRLFEWLSPFTCSHAYELSSLSSVS